MTAPLGRRSFLALALAASTAGCSLFGGDGMPTETQATPTAVQSLAEGHVVAVGRDFERTTVETAGTDTPVQDALDAVADSGGRVYLPPGRVTDRGPVRPHENTGIYGFGMNVSVLEITGRGTDGIRFDRDERTHRVQLDGFELRGPGANTGTGVAVHFLPNERDAATDPADLYVGRLYCREWSNTVYRVDEGVGPFQCRHDFLRMDDCDAGDRDGLVEWRSGYGPANWFGTIVAYPTAGRSGRDSRLLYQRGGELSVQHVTVGTTTGRLVDTTGGRLHVGRLHYEPVGQRSIPSALVAIGDDAVTRVDDVIVDSGAVDYVYELTAGAGDAVLSNSTEGSGVVRENVVHVSNRLDPDRPSWYFGRASDVDVAGSWRTGSLRALGRAGVGLG
ncbi:hypothetical protein [Haloarcula onubensis]|uniref:Pectate lyase superfamily protein domain-containing protein n=1 Tax=Haloarcula onubensis TaxID=2950539 RepID=A0ABU2FUU6_9EURY|nr:hypothetical protein [Halomicroarcula sp. S3CR25-11]MDS0284544.1 hypothetical protein [Halomicroarcula sp. S3CR25-11]